MLIILGCVGWMVTCVVFSVLFCAEAKRRVISAEQRVALDDDGVLGHLEIAAETGSSLAVRLLAEAKRPLLPAVPEWFHHVNVPLPHEEHWNLFLKDAEKELDDAGKLACVRRWLGGGQRFTHYEKVEIARLFESEKERDEVRMLLWEGEGRNNDVWAYCGHLNPKSGGCRWFTGVGRYVSEDEVRGKAFKMMEDWLEKEGDEALTKKVTVAKLNG